LWAPLTDAVTECTKRNILTDLTTNGSLLTEASIKKLGEAGLDYLNISVDGLKSSHISGKNSVSREGMIGLLKEARANYRMHFRLNSVIHKNNYDDIKELIEFSKNNNVQISLGYVVPPIEEMRRDKEDIYFGLEDTSLLQDIISYILRKKKNGYPIIDPEAYFENIFRFLNREKFWECNYPTRYGWINVAPDGQIRSCTKKMDRLELNFLDLDIDNLKTLRETLNVKVNECNIDCYSNCAYDSYFYTRHKLRMLKKILNRIKHRV
jgi:MoaA/NifB/PqqE/SkfB family radical SAM enzyme